MHQNGIILVMTATRPTMTARTVRFPVDLRDRIASDAERCGRSFEQHVLAILRQHFGESVDLAPAPDALLALAQASVLGLSSADQELVSGRRRR